MKKILTLGFSLLLATVSFSQELPKPSPKATVAQRVGLTDIEITYSRPAVNDREIWGDLIPYNKVWRTGANEPTKITFSTPVKFGKEEVEAGEYAIFTMIDSNNLDTYVYINSVTEGWGTDKYEEKNNVAVYKTRLLPSKLAAQNMMFYFDRITSGKAHLILSWANKEIFIPISVDYIAPSMRNIDMALSDNETPDFRTYKNAAAFYIDNELKPEVALEYAKTSVEMEEHFWNVYTLSEAYAANGDYKNAIKYANKSKELSIKANYEPYVKMNEKNIQMWETMK